MSETTITIDNESEATKLADERELETPEDINQDEQEAVEPTDEASPEIDHADILRQAKLAHLVDAYLPDGTDVETELAHVGGLEVDDQGNVKGEPVYRKPQLATKSTKASTAKTKTRTPAKQVNSWEQRKRDIHAAKIAAGIIHE